MRWLIGIAVILAGLILNFQRVVGNRIDQLDGRVGRLEQALADHRVESSGEFSRLDEALTDHRTEAAREFGEIRSGIDFLLTGESPGGF